mmetsp:Transcript_15686/g.31866  ORF Transcript_15686/g.31866 Transcript_15686/m.31866 type:complete len:201 (-) Transcript_15686:5115-5717(-)
MALVFSFCAETALASASRRASSALFLSASARSALSRAVFSSFSDASRRSCRRSLASSHSFCLIASSASRRPIFDCSRSSSAETISLLLLLLFAPAPSEEGTGRFGGSSFRGSDSLPSSPPPSIIAIITDVCERTLGGGRMVPFSAFFPSMEEALLRDLKSFTRRCLSSSLVSVCTMPVCVSVERSSFRAMDALSRLKLCI